MKRQFCDSCMALGPHEYACTRCDAALCSTCRSDEQEDKFELVEDDDDE